MRIYRYAGYVPGLKYAFGHTYGYSESRLFKAHHPGHRADTSLHEKLTPYQPPLRDTSSVRKVEDACLHNNGVHHRISKVEEQPRRVQWTDGQPYSGPDPGVMDIIDSKNIEPPRNVSIQCSLEETLEKDAERERLQSVATQWSDQEAHREKRFNAATQWTPVDFTPLKTIPGYTGHLPGRHYVNPGKTFCQEVDALLTTFHPNSSAVVPISRHTYTSALQQMPERPPEGLDDPYFDKRPPSTYANNCPITGYKGFVPRVRTSTSSLGIRYIKAVEKSLHDLHEQKQRFNRQVSDPETSENTPKQFLENRPLHTPRHKPHPRQQLSEEDDWRLVYRRPPSTYNENSKTYIPGYKGFVPHLRGSPNVVGVRYSKAAQRCLLKSHADNPNNQRQPEKQPKTKTDINANTDNNPAEDEYVNNFGDEDKENEEAGLVDDSYIIDPDEINNSKEANSMEDNRLKKEVSPNRPYREQHSDYMSSRKPSTYRSDDRYPIPGYQGFVPRLKDSPTTLGLRYTKAAVKTLEDVHKTQLKKLENYY
ncbi:hypothetical protein JTE90_010506 [Oedothorax gibbosus]|uniref:Ciliary microtubule inner protein 2A-C-like domain-containing protein n=1 Tax=Oedothorax gibbosus TaxID=931172 RepID=A0AAV6VZV7_9ARAC|nr:hypothetical protein JTE90_010506 [Oedothorax gibbosus]